MARSCEFLEMYLNLNTEALLLQTESFDKLYIILPKGTGKKLENTVTNGLAFYFPGQVADAPCDSHAPGDPQCAQECLASVFFRQSGIAFCQRTHAVVQGASRYQRDSRGDEKWCGWCAVYPGQDLCIDGHAEAGHQHRYEDMVPVMGQ